MSGAIIRGAIIGAGGYLPEKVITNYDIEKKMDTSHDWIVQRTGIHQRHMAATGQTTADLAVEAARKALHHAGIEAGELDGLIIATTTPDQVFPAVAVTVQAHLGMRPGTFAFDVQAVCSGFIYAMTIGNNFIITGQAKRVLIIGAEIMSRILDWSDRGTAFIFGDGAGAVILEAVEGKGDVTDRGILSTHLHTDGTHKELLHTGENGMIFMQGREVFRHAVERLAEVVDEVLTTNHLDKAQIDWLVPHQANKRIIDATAEKLGLPSERVILTIDKHGNTSAASVPLALAFGVENNMFKSGDLLLLEAMGAGLTWGAALIRW